MSGLSYNNACLGDSGGLDATAAANGGDDTSSGKMAAAAAAIQQSEEEEVPGCVSGLELNGRKTRRPASTCAPGLRGGRRQAPSSHPQCRKKGPTAGEDQKT